MALPQLPLGLRLGLRSACLPPLVLASTSACHGTAQHVSSRAFSSSISRCSSGIGSSRAQLTSSLRHATTSCARCSVIKPGFGSPTDAWRRISTEAGSSRSRQTVSARSTWVHQPLSRTLSRGRGAHSGSWTFDPCQPASRATWTFPSSRGTMSSLRAFHIGSASRSTASLSALGASHATSPSTAEPLKRSSTLFSIPTSQDLAAPVKEEKFNDGTRPIVAYHLLATFILVYAIIVVGGLTRLTESGLSITEWNPGTKGMKWPANQQEWQVEWDKYRETPEWALLNKHMTLEDFKSIYMWEWGHRMLGRFIGVFFLVPAIAFSVSGLAGRRTRLKLLAIASGIGFQGALGWYMVKSGLAAPEKKLVAPIAAHPNSTAPGSNTGAQPRLDPNLQTAEWTPRVSHFRLAAHLGTAFLVGLGCLHTAAVILRPRFFSKLTYVAQSAKALSSSSVRRYASQTKAVTTFVFVTAMTGALVAGLDAGLVYNEWPTMGDGRLAPPLAELLDRRYTLSGGQSEQDDSGWRAVVGNFTSNPVSVQLMHRTLATTSLVLVLALGWRGLRLYRASRAAGYPLPKSVPRLALLSAGVVSMQASLGIFTLLYLVPLELASAHQAGSVALLSSLVALTAALRKAPNSLWSSAITRGPVKSEAQKRADQVAANALRKVLRETSAATPASRVRLS